MMWYLLGLVTIPALLLFVFAVSGQEKPAKDYATRGPFYKDQ